MLRPAPRRLFVLLLALVAGRGGSMARAQGPTAAADLVVGGGHDSNVFLRVSPRAGVVSAPVGGAFAHVAPGISLAALRAGWRFELAYAGDYRAARDAGHLYFQEAQLAIGAPQLGPLRLTAALGAGRFDASAFRDESFWLLFGAGGARLDLGEAFRVVGSYRAEPRLARAAALGWETLHAATLAVAYRPDPRFDVGPFGTVIVMPGQEGRFARGRGGLAASLAIGRLLVQPSLWTGATQLGPDARYLQVGATVEARWQLTSALDLVAAGQLTRTLREPPAAVELDRQFALLGLAFRAARGGTALTRAPVTEDGLRPVVDRGRVRLRLRAPGAAEVAVVGSWDDWQGRHPLTRRGTVWEAWVPVPPGSHRYRFLVDGEARRPPDAPRYVEDDFGGEDGAFDVPEAAP